MYDFRARVWSPELAAFLQPDEFGYLTRNGTLWSWPRQNPFKYADPTGRDPIGRAIGSAVGEILGGAVGGLLGTAAGGAATIETGPGALGGAAVGAVEGGGLGADFGAVAGGAVGDALGDALKGLLAKATSNDAKECKKGPKPNEGIAKPHGGKSHDDAIDDEIAQLENDPTVRNIRKNQQQVDVDGNNVGRNRPDIQYDKGDIHYNHEIDTTPAGSQRHQAEIPANDPDAVNIFDLL